jgi:hypothetical protein
MTGAPGVEDGSAGEAEGTWEAVLEIEVALGALLGGAGVCSGGLALISAVGLEAALTQAESSIPRINIKLNRMRGMVSSVSYLLHMDVLWLNSVP